MSTYTDVTDKLGDVVDESAKVAERIVTATFDVVRRVITELADIGKGDEPRPSSTS